AAPSLRPRCRAWDQRRACHAAGPELRLAKRLQRWGTATARDAGATVSMNVALPTRTRSVVKNRALAAAYARAHRFAVEVFEPAKASTLMAAMLFDELYVAEGEP